MWGHKGTPHLCTLRTAAGVVATWVAVAARAVAMATYGTHPEVRKVGRVVLREAPGVAKAMDSAGAQGEPSAAVATSRLVAWLGGGGGLGVGSGLVTKQLVATCLGTGGGDIGGSGGGDGGG